MDKPIDDTKQFAKSGSCCGGTGKDGNGVGHRYDKEGNRVMRVSSACCRNGENWKYHKWNIDPALGLYRKPPVGGWGGTEPKLRPPEVLENMPIPKVNENRIEIDENGEMIKFPKHS